MGGKNEKQRLLPRQGDERCLCIIKAGTLATNGVSCEDLELLGSWRRGGFGFYTKKEETLERGCCFPTVGSWRGRGRACRDRKES